MFNIGSGELVLIAVVALLVLGPKRLPELARGLGKFLREFRRQTDEVRGVVEREFYRMDQDLETPPVVPQLTAPADTTPATLPAEGAVAMGAPAMEADAPMDHSDPRHPDYGKPDEALLPAEQAVSHHTDPTPAHPELATAPTAPTAAPVPGESEKKAS